MPEPIIIVGAGQSAAQAVASLRGEGYDGPVQLFGDEPFLPYQRPPLSKAFLAGETTPERLELRPAAFYEEKAVELQLGCRIARIDPAAHTIECVQGRFWRYSKLLLTTGTRPRPLPIPGDALEGVHHIRAIRDVERFRAEFRPGARLVIVGGGYIGLEVAAKARKMGLDVTVLETADRILKRVVTKETAEFLVTLHEAHGVVIRPSSVAARFVGEHRVEAVELGDGTRVPADVVLVAIGAVPNTELAASAGIDVANGIVVDAATRTSAPDIHAAGDVVSFPSGLYGRNIRLESVQNANDQAKAAVAAMLGCPVTYDPVPWFWSDQYDTKLQIAGLSDGFDRIEVDRAADDSRFAARYFRSERLIAVDSINDPKTHLGARRALAERIASQEAA